MRPIPPKIWKKMEGSKLLITGKSSPEMQNPSNVSVTY